MTGKEWNQENNASRKDIGPGDHHCELDYLINEKNEGDIGIAFWFSLI